MQKIIEVLEKIDINKLEKDFDPEIYEANNVFPYDWHRFKKETWFEYLIEEYTYILNIYREAKEKNKHVLIAFHGPG